MSTIASVRSALPATGDLVRVRGRPWLVTAISTSSLPLDLRSSDLGEAETLVSLVSVEDDGLGDELTVLWEVEPGRTILEKRTLPDPSQGRFDDPATLQAFLNALRWGAITNAETDVLQAPFRAGIAIEDYQLDPLVRSLRMPRVNLLVADDVGLGKTIEAGLVVQELILRHRARRVLVVCPAPLTTKWRDEMQARFGLEFHVVDTDELRTVRRERGLHANPFRVHLRTIVSLSWLRGERCQRLIDEFLTAGVGDGVRHPLDLLIVDEAHHCAPPGRGRYAIDSQQTRAVRGIAQHAEHRLFLSATPHNGYMESWTALLAMLDPQRFARGVAPQPSALSEVLIRRLKSEIVDAEGQPRYRLREVREIVVDYPTDELEVHRLLREYTQLRRERIASSSERDARASDLVTLLLKKRLFSSPKAFAQTLAVHVRGVTREAPVTVDAEWSDRERRELLFGDWSDDETFEDAEGAAADVASRAGGLPSSQEHALLRGLTQWAESHADRSDAKARALIAHLVEVCRNGDSEGTWNDERVAVFTEYRDTQRWLADLMERHGLSTAGRLEVLHGGTDDDTRARIMDEFQKPPSLHPVRILLATDTASEGIDLQHFCHRLIHYDIPFNPNRLEQRAGRIDRYGQMATPLIHHFVGAHWQDAAVHITDADLEFLTRVARKVATMRVDLGSVNPVLARAVEARMLGLPGGDIDVNAVQPASNEKTALKVEHDLRETAARLRATLAESRRDLHCEPADVAAVVRTGLALGRQPEIVEECDRVSAAQIYRVPQLSGAWARTVTDLEDEDYGRRPMTFDAAVAAGRQDVVLGHLQHPLVAMATRLLRADIWSGQYLARVAAVSGPVTEIVLAAYSRLVVVGVDGDRLHEELFTAAGELRGASFRRLGVGAVAHALDVTFDGGAPRPATQKMRDEFVRIWPHVMGSLEKAIEARADERWASLTAALARRRQGDEVRTRQLFTDFRHSLEAAINILQAPQQLQMRYGDLNTAERDQLDEDVDAWMARLQRIPAEEQRELDAITRRYESVRRLIFPAAIVLIVPGGRR